MKSNYKSDTGMKNHLEMRKEGERILKAKRNGKQLRK